MAEQGDAGPREPDKEFAPSEHLFRRVPLRDLVGDSVNDIALPSPSFSVNREKYSAPRDVLNGLEGYRVAAFTVAILPNNVVSDDGARYGMTVEHEPEADNYAHSEVHTLREGEKTSRKPSLTTRKKLRDLLRRGVKILDLD